MIPEKSQPGFAKIGAGQSRARRAAATILIACRYELARMSPIWQLQTTLAV
jgi:hypothetical protein